MARTTLTETWLKYYLLSFRSSHIFRNIWFTLCDVAHSVATNNSLFEYSNNRRPNNDIRIRIRSFLKIRIIFEYSNNKLRITNNWVLYFHFQFSLFFHFCIEFDFKYWVNLCRNQFISDSHIANISLKLNKSILFAINTLIFLISLYIKLI